MTTTSIAKRISPMLLTANMEETILFYQNVPGFKTNHEIGGVLDWETGWPNHPFSEGRIRGGYEVCPRFGNGPCRFSHAPTRSIRCNSRRPRRTVRRSMRARYQRFRAHRQHRKAKLSPGCALLSPFRARSRNAKSQVLRQRRPRSRQRPSKLGLYNRIGKGPRYQARPTKPRPLHRRPRPTKCSLFPSLS
jgi:hypothetical protein